MQYKNEEYDPIFHDRFKALSVKQPYADFIACGVKDIEIRTRPTKYRGELLICASRDGRPSKEAPGYGCTLAFVELYDCKPASKLTDDEWNRTKIPSEMIARIKELGACYAWFLRRPRRVIEYPVKGQLGIFNLVYTKGLIMEYPSRLKNPVVK